MDHEQYDDIDDSEGEEDSLNESDESENLVEENEKPKKRKKDSGEGRDRFKKVKYEDISDQPNASKSKKKELYKQPTVEELNELHETETLYSSTLCRLQIEQVLEAIRIKQKRTVGFGSWFAKFQTFMKNMENHDKICLNDIKNSRTLNKKMKKFKLFLSKCPEIVKCDQDISMSFLSPTNIQLFGLQNLDSFPGPNFEVNINLEMPKETFHVKDYLNNRYFVKRYFYLMYIAYNIEQSKLCSKIECSYEDVKLLPILKVTLLSDLKTTIKIFPSPPSDYFKPARFMLDKNNVKQNVFRDEFYDIDEEIMKWSTTLQYNSAMLHDMTLASNHTYIDGILRDMDKIREGLKLLYLWIRQHELNVGRGSISPLLLTGLLIHLVKKKKINNYMSSYQVVRNFWNYFSAFDLQENPIAISDDVSSEILEVFKLNFDIVVLDASGCYNIASFLSAEFYQKFKIECKIAFNLIDKGGVNNFHSLFVSRTSKNLQYDLILNLTSEDMFKNVYELTSEQEKSKYIGDYQSLIVGQVLKILHQGFNKRATLIVPYVIPGTSFLTKEEQVNNDISNFRTFDKISFGINLDPNHAFSILEMGPALNDPKEKEFKKFWGHLSSDRRFKDGTVCVAVYFETKTKKDRRSIIEKIISYIFDDMLKVKYNSYYNQIEDRIVNKRVEASYSLGTNEEASLKISTAADKLASSLRKFDIALKITGVQGISSVYSYTDVFPPISTTYSFKKTEELKCISNKVLLDDNLKTLPRYVKPIEMVLQLERSSKWPDVLEDLQSMKLAFYMELSKLLSGELKILTSVSYDFIDVFYEGFLFRCSLFIPREVSLLKKQVTVNGLVDYKDSPQSIDLEKKLSILPRIVGALRGLHFQHTSYGPSTALIKRWLNSHLLDSSLFPDVAVELLNAALYLTDSPYSPSVVPQIAFFRFLKFFSEFQWKLNAVVVNFNSDMSGDILNEIETTLQSNREAYPPLFVITPYDDGKSMFTKSSPTEEVLRKVKALATASLQYYDNIIVNNSSTSIKELFVPNYEGYNVLIQLKPSMNTRHYEQMVDESVNKVVFTAYDPEKSTFIPVVQFNPVEIFLKELRENYGDLAVFFHDSYGGCVIEVLWKPQALEPKEFKVSAVNGRKLVNGQLVLNTDALIEDFYILGGDLIQHIDVK